MIRAIRPSAMAQDDASMVSGWNVSPNVAYTLFIVPSASACAVFIFDANMITLLASGAAPVGVDQPCVLVPNSGQLGMVDTDLGWHLLITTDGTETERTIRIGPAVDLPDEIHPIYADDGLAVIRATAGIDAAAHYIDELSVSCPLGLDVGLGGIVSVPVDGVAVAGQVESITWTGTPRGATEAAVIRRHIAIAPELHVDPVPPVLVDDIGEATHLSGTSGNVLANDTSGLTITAVNGLSANVGAEIDGDNGGKFTINADGTWTFSPDGDFDLLGKFDTANTSMPYHASDGIFEVMATLTITVAYGNTAPIAVDDAGATDATTVIDGNLLTNDTDIDPDTLTVSKVAGAVGNVGVAVAGSDGGLFTISSNGLWIFDPNNDFGELTGSQTRTTSVGYHVSDGKAENDGMLTIVVSPSVAASIAYVGSAIGSATNASFQVELPAGSKTGDIVIVALGCAAGSGTPLMGMATTGFTLVNSLSANDQNDCHLKVFYKVLGSSFDSFVEITSPQLAGMPVTAAIHVWRNVHNTTPLDVAAVSTTGINGGVINSPSITPVTPGALVIICGSSGATGHSITPKAPPSGFGNTVECLLDLAYSSVVVMASQFWESGSVVGGAWTNLPTFTTNSWCAVTLALRPK